jgi:hypothetical protein
MRCPGHPHERGLVSYFSFTFINNRNISVSIIREPIECSDHNNHQSTEHPESEELYLNLQNHGMSPDNGTLHFNSEYNLLETYKFHIQILPWQNSNKRKTMGLNPSSINHSYQIRSGGWPGQEVGSWVSWVNSGQSGKIKKKLKI